MDKILGMLGLAYRAGKIKFGSESVNETIRGRFKPQLVILAADASLNSVKKISDGCAYHSVRLERLSCSMEEMGHALGGHSSVACAALTDAGFAKAICDLINKNKQQETAGGNLNDN